MKQQTGQSDIEIVASMLCDRIAEVQKLKTLLEITRDGLEYVLERHLDGDECLCDAARSTAAAAYSISDPER